MVRAKGEAESDYRQWLGVEDGLQHKHVENEILIQGHETGGYRTDTGDHPQHH